MTVALRAEWTKLRTSPGTAWLLLAIVALTIGVGAAAAATITCGAAGCPEDPAKISLTGVQLGQALVVILAVSSISGEHATGMLRVSLSAVPNRLRLLTAKALVVTGAIGAAGLVAVAGSFAAGRLLLPGSGFTEAHGFERLSLSEAAVLRATAGSVLYLVLIALVALGLSTVVRETAASIGLLLALLYLIPLLTQAVSSPSWKRHLQQITPTAGLSIQATTKLSSLPLTPWQGVGVLGCWAVGSLVLAAVVLHRRDV
ncbi:MAG: ABC transporter permease [Hamadaea sp.]|uniref:ABC transporter permease n=1 Tax=Hamadaea sp. TaxID=2024425 RepID=UPI001821107F|nr:ABC transporter permease [Hamadaea sp.]NUR70436.1 ABC transporter permease [Hamadaea sp.]NUT20026.1 ABC transporter permease [Hamadaea sp.]